MPNVGGFIVVQKHVHPRERVRGVVLLLTKDGDAARCFIDSFKQQRTGTASGIVDGVILTGVLDRCLSL